MVFVIFFLLAFCYSLFVLCGWLCCFVKVFTVCLLFVCCLEFVVFGFGCMFVFGMGWGFFMFVVWKVFGLGLGLGCTCWLDELGLISEWFVFIGMGFGFGSCL